MKIDLLGGTYQDENVQVNSQRTVNWYTSYSNIDQMAPAPTSTVQIYGTNRETSKEVKTLKPFAGLSIFTSIAGNKCRGTFSQNNRAFAVIDNTLYEILADTTPTNRGSLSGSPQGAANKVYFAANKSNQIFISDISVGYVYDIVANTLTKVTDIDFPGAETVFSQDEYFMAVFNGRVYFSDLSNGLSWTGVNVFTPTYKADKTIFAISLQEEIYCFGSEHTEVYFNDGTTPFSRVPRSSVQYGLLAKDSVIILANTIFLLSRSAEGQPRVLQIGGDHSFSPISTSNINFQLGQYQNLEDAYAWGYLAEDGHTFYCLTIPAADKTFVYDLATREWVEQSSYLGNYSNGCPIFGRCLANHHMFLNGKHLFGSFKDGNIYTSSRTAYTDNSQPIVRIRDTQIFNSDDKVISCAELALDVNTGQGALTGQGVKPVIMSQVSKDGGKTFSPERHVKLGVRGDYKFRARIRLLGSARNWVLRFKCSDPINLVLIGAYVRGSVSAY